MTTRRRPSGSNLEQILNNFSPAVFTLVTELFEKKRVERYGCWRRFARECKPPRMTTRDFETGEINFLIDSYSAYRSKPTCCPPDQAETLAYMESYHRLIASGHGKIVDISDYKGKKRMLLDEEDDDGN